MDFPRTAQSSARFAARCRDTDETALWARLGTTRRRAAAATAWTLVEARSREPILNPDRDRGWPHLAHSTGADEFVQLVYAEAAARRFSCHRRRACRTRSLTVAGLSRRSLGEGGRIVL
jgi:hypothetical protein